MLLIINFYKLGTTLTSLFILPKKKKTVARFLAKTRFCYCYYKKKINFDAIVKTKNKNKKIKAKKQNPKNRKQ